MQDVRHGLFSEDPRVSQRDLQKQGRGGRGFTEPAGQARDVYPYLLPALPPFVFKPPFVPFPIGNVRLPEGIAVLGQMTRCKYEDLKIGIDVELVLERLFEEDGKDL
jgi:uncharacterized OB-fold protein